ncbi:MAG: T9SS type A sorting domain-containing protein [bacterium]
MIADTYGNDKGWLYWHITYSTMPFNVGEYVQIDDYIGSIATWPVAQFHHCHFTKMFFTGSWYTAIGNPLEYMVPDTDNDSPTFANAYNDNMFAFRTNTIISPQYLDPTNLSGEVDIVALIRDKIGHPTWNLVPYEIKYWIDGELGQVPPTTTVKFTGNIPTDSTVSTIYSDDTVCDSNGDYSARDFYFILTNTDGDGIVETEDEPYCWDTTLLPDGDYTVYVTAYDEYGNSTTEQMDVTVKNTQSDLKITDFYCKDVKGAILITWTTDESEQCYFNLYRREIEGYSIPLTSSKINDISSDSLSHNGYKLLNSNPISGNSPFMFLDRDVKVGIEYKYLLEIVENDKRSDVGTVVGSTNGKPTDFSLVSNYPNPFSDRTTIVFTLPETSIVEIALYDITGRLVKEVSEGQYTAGEHTIVLDCSDMKSGVYLLSMKAGYFTAFRRITKVE